MTNAVITTVEAMAEGEGQPLIVGGMPLFEWRPNVPISDIDDEESIPVLGLDDEEPIIALPEDTDDPALEDADVTDEPAHAEREAIFDDVDNVDLLDNNGPDEQAETNVVDTPDEPTLGAAEEPDTINENDDINDDEVVLDHEGQRSAETDTNADHTHRYNLRSNQKHETGVQLLQHAADKFEESPRDMQRYIFGYIMTQMTATAGIKKHGQAAVEALLQEFCQLDNKNVFEPLHANELTTDQKQAALRAINLIKEKRSGKLKGRTCADGRPQRALYTKDETTSPTLSTDALLMSLMIDALEKMDVATADVEGAYLHADMVDYVIMKMVGEAADIMCKVNPKYKVFVVVENGKKTLYLQLLKALYGCVKSALLWYDLFSSTLSQDGFELNPYDTCVANKLINGKQCTVAWYVDDNKISHVDSNVVTGIIEKIESRFGKMTVT
jgi:hypothetical protein